jgi:hypothetical protein
VTPDEIKRLYDNIVRITQVTFDEETYQRIKFMIDDLGDMLFMCPVSDRDDRGFDKPGGLMAHMVSVTSHARKLAPILAPDETPESIIKVALFHDIGRVGDPAPNRRIPYYLPEMDAWRREKLGKSYKYNEELPKMTHSARSLYVLSNYGISLTMHEWIAIQTAYGYGLEENRFYIGDDRQLTLLLQTAVRRAVLG